MPVSTIDPATALIVIDLQKGLTGGNAVHSVGDVVEQARRLLAKFRSLSLPVVLVNVTGGAPGRTERKSSGRNRPADWVDFIPEIGPEESDHCVSKSTWGAFSGTGLDAHLKAKGVTTTVLCGIATSIGVESTARQAHDLGFNVVLAIDAMTDVNADAHKNSVEIIFPRLGETGKTEEVLALMDRLEK